MKEIRKPEDAHLRGERIPIPIDRTRQLATGSNTGLIKPTESKSIGSPSDVSDSHVDQTKQLSYNNKRENYAKSIKNLRDQKYYEGFKIHITRGKIVEISDWAEKYYKTLNLPTIEYSEKESNFKAKSHSIEKYWKNDANLAISGVKSGELDGEELQTKSDFRKASRDFLTELERRLQSPEKEIKETLNQWQTLKAGCMDLYQGELDKFFSINDQKDLESFNNAIITYNNAKKANALYEPTQKEANHIISILQKLIKQYKEAIETFVAYPPLAKIREPSGL